VLCSHTLLDNPEPWDFKKQPAADIVVINIGTNDNNQANNVSTQAYIDAVTKIIQGVHGKWPNAQVIVMVSEPVQTQVSPETLLI
jgi:lysophospholipase L1-like esterase